MFSEIEKTWIILVFGRKISRRTENLWPAHSPDLIPLDFNFWAAAQARFIWKTHILLSLSYNVSKPSKKGISRI
ncbi:Hypothetical protein FKW44_004336 [Caligus rogercresseyi]|uniref:Uncharacterized protein n=1 Tax=Caligus rogercresseyi TaxID=217165 RepID=A0A7T8HMM3_CALRO|nr:Hypothetical protein FKW44_004336 [Caligus rogercresseyi]